MPDHHAISGPRLKAWGCPPDPPTAPGGLQLTSCPPHHPPRQFFCVPDRPPISNQIFVHCLLCSLLSQNNSPMLCATWTNQCNPYHPPTDSPCWRCTAIHAGTTRVRANHHFFFFWIDLWYATQTISIEKRFPTIDRYQWQRTFLIFVAWQSRGWVE